ncbi:hypothetical protein ACEPAI_2896 [Sanghuangporus weigelae]
MMSNETIDLFLDIADGLSCALTRLLHVADEMSYGDWPKSSLQKIENVSSASLSYLCSLNGVNECLTSNIEEFDDPVWALKSMRKILAWARLFYQILCIGTMASDARMGRFRETLDDLQHHIDSSAMKHGLDRLPVELLSRILLASACDMKSTIALSHVCQRFRCLVNGSPCFWQRFPLLVTWNSEQIHAVAKRSAFRSLRAVIDCVPVTGRRVTTLPSIHAIFSFHSCLQELSVSSLLPEYVEAVRGHLSGLHFPVLQKLVSRWHHSIVPPHPQDIYEMPSLRILDTYFIPRIEQAGSLLQLTVYLSGISELGYLLDFLSSTTALLEINIRFGWVAEEHELVTRQRVQLPKLATLRISFEDEIESLSIFAQKIHSSSLRTIELTCGMMEALNLSETSIQRILRSDLSFTELQLSGFYPIDLGHVPQQVEVLTLAYGRYARIHFRYSGTLNSHHLRLVRFRECKEHTRDFVQLARHALLAARLGGVQFEFIDTYGYRNGICELKDLKSAFIDKKWRGMSGR